jgi:acylphosphatase
MENEFKDAIVSIIKNKEDNIDVVLEGEVDDIICMISAFMLSSETAYKIVKSAVEVTEKYLEHKESNKENT